MTARVSVVMPAYQAAAYIGAAVASVLSQTFEDLELIVVDDGSTDETTAIVEAHRGRLRLISLSENLGPAAARNAGIAASDSELVTFLDSDDFLFPGHIDGLVARWEEKGGIATANSYLLFPGGIDPRRLRYKGSFPRPDRQRLAILEQNFLSPMSLLSRTAGEGLGWFDESLKGPEDWDLWMRAVLSGERASMIARPSALYRVNPHGLSAAQPEMDAAVLQVLHKAASRSDLSARERSYLEMRLAGPEPRELVRSADERLRAGEYRRAANHYRAAAARVPSERLLVWKARLLTFGLPLVGPLLRARMRRIENALGVDERHHR